MPCWSLFQIVHSNIERKQRKEASVQNGRIKRCRQRQAEHDAGQRRGLQRRRHFRPFGKIRQIPVAFLVPDGYDQRVRLSVDFGVHVHWERTAVQVSSRF